jgi:hypothetical protein
MPQFNWPSQKAQLFDLLLLILQGRHVRVLKDSQHVWAQALSNFQDSPPGARVCWIHCALQSVSQREYCRLLSGTMCLRLGLHTSTLLTTTIISHFSHSVGHENSCGTDRYIIASQRCMCTSKLPHWFGRIDKLCFNWVWWTNLQLTSPFPCLNANLQQTCIINFQRAVIAMELLMFRKLPSPRIIASVMVVCVGIAVATISDSEVSWGRTKQSGTSRNW